jgi:hypothetical protein
MTRRAGASSDREVFEKGRRFVFRQGWCNSGRFSVDCTRVGGLLQAETPARIRGQKWRRFAVVGCKWTEIGRTFEAELRVWAVFRNQVACCPVGV